MVHEFVSGGVKNSKEQTLPPLTNKQTKHNESPSSLLPFPVERGWGRGSLHRKKAVNATF